MNLFPKKRSSQKGFTLLLAALVASIVVSIGAAIYSIAIKELNLSSVGRDSQFAFYAADSAAECALYYDINRIVFSTSSPSGTIQVSCGGATTTVSSVSNISSSGTNGNQNFLTQGTYSWQTPSSYNSLTVTINAASGGGGGGGDSVTLHSGTAGGNGTNSTWAFSGGATLTAFAGHGGGGGTQSGTNGSTGSNGTPACVSGCTAGGAFGNGTGFGGHGGTGGKGGQTSTTYTFGQLGAGTTITIVVGQGGTAGLKGGNAQPGNPGSDGSVLITWTAPQPAWQSTVFSFQTQPNGTCAITTFTKALVAGAITNDIHADGSNVPCTATTTSPRALQRSVEIKY